MMVRLLPTFAMFLVLLAGTCSTSSAANSPQILYSVEVHVIDESGTGVDDAHVSLVGLEQRAQPGFAHFTPGTLDVDHQEHGIYEAVVNETHHQLLHHEEVMLLVDASGCELALKKVTHPRLASEVPIEIEVHKSEPGRIRVVDASGSPIAGVTVAPAILNNTPVPLFEALPRTELSDQDGFSQAQWMVPSKLSMVYVFGKSFGNQRLPITKDANGQSQAVALPTKHMTGRWSAPIKPDPGSGFYDAPIQVASSPEELSYAQIAAASYAWDSAKQREDGTLDPVNLTLGNIRLHTQMPSSMPLATRANPISPKQVQGKDSFHLEWVDGIRVRGNVIDEDSGEPISGIAVRQFTNSRAESITGTDGTFELWFPPQQRISYFPSDVRGRYIKAGGFYLYPTELPTDGQLLLQPQAMQKISPATGRVVDSNGGPVAGVEIRCEYKDERFTKTQKVYSNSEGEFRFFGVLADSAVQLTARSEDAMTAAPTAIQLAQDAPPELTIVPRHGVKVIGRVIDSSGHPIEKVNVTLLTPQVHQKEMYNGRDTTAVPLLDADVSVTTGSDGMFETPPIIDWERELSVTLNAHGYRKTATYWREASIAGQAKTALNLGDLTIQRDWAVVNETIRIVDSETGAALPGAKVACHGAYVDHQAKRADSDGYVSFSIRDSTAVFAAHSQGYRPKLLFRRPDTAIESIQLVPVSQKPYATALSRQTVTWQTASEQTVTNKTADNLAELAASLVSLVEKPKPQDSFHRLSTYYRSLSVADWDQTLADVEVFAAMPDKKQVVSMVIGRMSWLDESQMADVDSFLDDQLKLQRLMEKADRTVGSDNKLEFLGEAMIQVQEKTGDNALTWHGRLAVLLLEAGETDSARQLLVDSYEDHPKLNQVLGKGERSKVRALRGTARVYLPVYAVVDVKKACDLIRLTAYPDEIDRLQTMAIRFAAEYSDQSLDSICRLVGKDRLNERGLMGHYLSVKHRDVELGLAIADRCNDSLGKADFLFQLAKTSDADIKAKNRLARMALEIVQTTESSKLWLAERISDVGAWDRDLADEYLFTSFWVENPSTRITPFYQVANLAKHLSASDPEVARALIEPCFDDWSWLFDGRDNAVMFSQATPLHAAALIDPDWTIELVDDLFTEYLSEHPSRKLSVVEGIITSLVE